MKLFYKNILKAIKKHKKHYVEKKRIIFVFINIILLPQCFINLEILKLVIKYSDAVYEQVVEVVFRFGSRQSGLNQAKNVAILLCT
jgi:hypothetical protein